MSKVAHSIQEKARTGDVQITESVEFCSLLLSDNVLNGLKNAGFVRPSPIQLKAIPLGRCGLDLIVQAKSGTGKTCVFSVIALENIVTDTASTQVLVLAPTREIAVQIWEVINSIGSATRDLECHTFIGGLPLHEDRIKLKKCHIAVGTPGRVKQLIEGGVLRTDSLRLFILDEADKLLEESFQEQINWIYSTLPENKQMLALSATYPEYLADHLTAYMRSPTFLRLNISDPALLGIRQYYTTVAYHPLSHVVFEEKCKVLSTILSSVSFQQCLVFSNLQTRAQTLADSLTSQGWPTACIAGCLDQKDRNQAMARLKTYKCRILISTDLTSRGIDADKVNMVINLDVPRDHETYLHRIGRAGRFGSFGIAITLVSDGQEKLSLDLLEKQCNTQIYTLPDPLPSDLAKPGSPIFLDDVVSSEVINTEKPASNESSPVKQKLSAMSTFSVNTTTYSQNENVKVRKTVDVSSNKDINKDNLEGKEEVSYGLKQENADVMNVQWHESKNQDISSILDDNVDTEVSTAVSYEDVEYIDMNENLNIDIKADIDPKNRTGVDIVPDGKIVKSNSGKSIGNNIVEADSEQNEELLVENDKSKTDDVNVTTEGSWLSDKVDNLMKNECSISQPEIILKTNSCAQNHNTLATPKNTTFESKECNNLQSFSNCQLSVSAFEKVNISNVFKDSTGFKALSSSHSYNTARESLKMFREKHKNDVEPVETKENCSIPKIKNENSESETLQCAIAQVQDILENRFYVQICDTNSTKVEVKQENIPEVDSISSEDEFEAKEDVLSEANSVTTAFKVEVENKLETFAEKTNITKHKEEILEQCLEKPKENVKKSFQKPKNQRFGFQGNFAIGHLLQQERNQQFKAENFGNTATSKESEEVSKNNDSLEVIANKVDRMLDNVSYIPLSSKIIDDHENQNREGAILSSLVKEEKNCSIFPIKKELDEINKGHVREKVFSMTNEINLENDSDSVSSTTDSESTDRELGALPKTYTRTRKSPESRSRLMERAQRYREHTRSDTRSEDSGVYSRPSYQEQWRKWYKQYEDWHQQTMNMWGYSGMLGNPAHDYTSRMNMQGHGSVPGWQDPSQSMYYPYQNYHPSYHLNYPPDFSMFHRNSFWYQYQNSSKLNEQMGDAFQYQEEYIKEMSKCSKR